MSIGFWGHMIHNVVLVIVYALLGTVYLPGFIRRLDIPLNARNIFRFSCITFFFLCSFTHFELMLHATELPNDYYTLYHNLFGFLQAIGAIVLVYVLHPLIFPKER